MIEPLNLLHLAQWSKRTVRKSHSVSTAVDSTSTIQSSSSGSQSASVPACSTLLDDEITRCPDKPTHGRPVQRCELHHRQYQIMTRDYKQAQAEADSQVNEIPTLGDIATYSATHEVVEKARIARKYLKDIRKERAGRDIHHRRFFLKVDDGHKIRIKVLAKRMKEALEIMQLLEEKALELSTKDHPQGQEWLKAFQRTSLLDLGEVKMEEHMKPFKDIFTNPNSSDDLIERELRTYIDRQTRLHAFKPFIESDNFDLMDRLVPAAFISSSPAQAIRSKRIFKYALDQYTLRIIFHDPQLYLKSLDKVSLKDLIMDDDFDSDDTARFLLLLVKRLAIGLLWWKDSVVEAIDMVDRPQQAPANSGDVANRVKVLSGWIYNVSHKKPASNEAWCKLLTLDKHEQNTENRLVRLCHSFDELHCFLSYGVLGYMDPPSFCLEPGTPHLDCQIYRKHLSLCGVVVVDAIGPSPFPSPMPTNNRARYHARHIQWLELESRAFIFGALRNEPDAFTDRFLDELRASPDLFYVVTRSDTDTGHEVREFGIDAHHVRLRRFDAPPPSQNINTPIGFGDWTIVRSARDVLYGHKSDRILPGAPSPNMSGIDGYLTRLEEGTSRRGSTCDFFHFKQFPVKYFAIPDAQPNRHFHELFRNVAWAAFRAHGLVRGKAFSEREYDRASDHLFLKHAKERLSFLPSEDWAMTGHMSCDQTDAMSSTDDDDLDIAAHVAKAEVIEKLKNTVSQAAASLSIDELLRSDGWSPQTGSSQDMSTSTTRDVRDVDREPIHAADPFAPSEGDHVTHHRAVDNDEKERNVEAGPIAGVHEASPTEKATQEGALHWSEHNDCDELDDNVHCGEFGATLAGCSLNWDSMDPEMEHMACKIARGCVAKAEAIKNLKNTVPGASQSIDELLRGDGWSPQTGSSQHTMSTRTTRDMHDVDHEPIHVAELDDKVYRGEGATPAEYSLSWDSMAEQMCKIARGWTNGSAVPSEIPASSKAHSAPQGSVWNWVKSFFW
ncbi:hypothetical protein BDZ89DRAFT_1035257 [Hymenopellis radicata]|nr:hypothetical protein BDZ89DRAFT_1035257 [Hymenopellis radicata]